MAAERGSIYCNAPAIGGCAMSINEEWLRPVRPYLPRLSHSQLWDLYRGGIFVKYVADERVPALTREVYAMLLSELAMAATSIGKELFGPLRPVLAFMPARLTWEVRRGQRLLDLLGSESVPTPLRQIYAMSLATVVPPDDLLALIESEFERRRTLQN
jgi:hypothetical protein